MIDCNIIKEDKIPVLRVDVPRRFESQGPYACAPPPPEDFEKMNKFVMEVDWPRVRSGAQKDIQGGTA